MNYKALHQLKPEAFKRLTGVRPETFELMWETLIPAFREFGHPRTLTIADHLLVTLLYWREYRTQFHLGQEFGVSESTVCRIIQKVEDTLIRSERFHLPGKKALQGDGTAFEVVVVDATESPMERPKKNSERTIRARRSGTPGKPNS